MKGYVQGEIVAKRNRVYEHEHGGRSIIVGEQGALPSIVIEEDHTEEVEISGLPEHCATDGHVHDIRRYFRPKVYRGSIAGRNFTTGPDDVAKATGMTSTEVRRVLPGQTVTGFTEEGVAFIFTRLP